MLVSQATRDLVQTDLRDLGDHRLKDLSGPQRLYQLGAGEFPPLRTLHQTNLPVTPTQLIGREREVEELLELLGREDVSVVTLTGAGGSGKTRLVMQAAAEAAEDYAEGVWFVRLSALRDADLVVAAIAQTLGLREGRGRSHLEVLGDYLRSRRLLLVLDNLEQLLPAVAGVVADLVAEFEGLDLLATSREPLRIGAEREYSVLPLAAAEAVALFAERASLELDGDRAIVAAICARLDGLPLAIELAAARVKVLPPAKLLERLEQRLPLLTGGARDAPERQRTLRATIAWSHDLLDERERQLFARLAVFAGGCTLEAAEVVCDADVDTLGSLLDKNLLRREESRYLMLETIREFAAEQLAGSDAEAATRLAHGLYFASLAEDAALDDPMRPDQAAWLDQLAVEHENVRAALEFADSEGLFELELRLVAALKSYWFLRGHWTEGRQRLERALEHAGDAAPATRAELLDRAAQLAERQGDYAHARAFSDEQLELARNLGDDRKLLGALMRAGIGASVRGDLERARKHLTEVLEIAGRKDDSWFAARAHLNLGFVLTAQKDQAGARDEFEHAVDLARRIGNKGLLSACLIAAQVELDEGAGNELVGSEAFLLAVEIRSPEHIAEALVPLAGDLAAQGDAETAAQLLGAAEGIRQELGLEQFYVLRQREDATAALVRARLGGERFDAAFTEGVHMGLDEAISLATEATFSADPS